MRLVKDKTIMLRGRIVGTIKKDRTYISHRNKEHFFRKYNGFGLSAGVIETLKKYDVEVVKIIYTKVDNTQEIFITPLNMFFEHGVIYRDGVTDYQRILSINKFKKVGGIND